MADHLAIIVLAVSGLIAFLVHQSDSVHHGVIGLVSPRLRVPRLTVFRLGGAGRLSGGATTAMNPKVYCRAVAPG